MTLEDTSCSTSDVDVAQRAIHVVRVSQDAEPEPTTLADALSELALVRHENETLKVALRSSRDIGAAMGILMAQHRLTQDQAFDRLRQTSQNQHRKLRDVASELLFTGILPPAYVNQETSSDQSR